MKEINIGKMLIQKRREKGITQEDVASYIGVSKASVSKWETGQSYPDITFLPQLAAYFNISIDSLLGYEPQMTKEDIKKLYHRIAKEFASRDFEEVMEQCNEIIKKYYSCYPLLLQMCILLVNHHMLAKDPKRGIEILETTSVLCQRIKEESEDVWISKEAALLEATTYLMQQKPIETLDILGETIRPITSENEMIAQAYQQLGNMKKAKEAIQISMYQHLMLLVGDATQYLALHGDNLDKVEEILSRTLPIVELYNVEYLQPNMALQLYLSAAQVYGMQAQKEKAMDWLQRFTKVCTNAFFPCELHGDGYFDVVKEWFQTFDLGTLAPRSEQVIKESMLQAIIQNPAFECLKDSYVFQSMIEQLKEKLGGN